MILETHVFFYLSPEPELVSGDFFIFIMKRKQHQKLMLFFDLLLTKEISFLVGQHDFAVDQLELVASNQCKVLIYKPTYACLGPNEKKYSKK